MPTTHLTEFFPTICAGFGLFLVGCVNLVFIRRGLGVRIMATVLTLGLVTALAAAIDYPGVGAKTFLLCALGMIPFLLLGSKQVISAGVGVLCAMQRPAIRYGLLTVVGIGTAIGSVIIFERAEKRAEESCGDLVLFDSSSPSVPSNRPPTLTDRGTAIVPKEAIALRENQQLAISEEQILASANLNDHVIRRGPCGDHTNCHGWVFAAGQFRLSPDDVQVILSDNGYHAVSTPRPGDVVIYRTNEGITHSAVVRYVTEGQPILVEGKWGALGLFLHPVDKSMYGTDFTYYRSPRLGHLLIGLAGEPPQLGNHLPAGAE